MTDTRLTNDEVALLRARLPLGYHLSEDLLRKAASEYLRITKAGVPHRHVSLHYSMTMLRDWLTRRLEDWPREHQDDMDHYTLRRLFALAAALGADSDVQSRIIAMHDAARKAGDT